MYNNPQKYSREDQKNYKKHLTKGNTFKKKKLSIVFFYLNDWDWTGTEGVNNKTMISYEIISN